MIKAETLQALRVLALYEVDSDTYEAWYKSLCRWYSREFHVPLPQVLEMSDESVLKTYYEDFFYQIKNSNDEGQQEKYNELKSLYLKDLTKPSAEDLQEKEDDNEWYQEELQKIKDEETKKVSKSKKLDEESDLNPNLQNNVQSTFYQGEDGSPIEDNSQ